MPDLSNQEYLHSIDSLHSKIGAEFLLSDSGHPDRASEPVLATGPVNKGGQRWYALMDVGQAKIWSDDRPTSPGMSGHRQFRFETLRHPQVVSEHDASQSLRKYPASAAQREPAQSPESLPPRQVPRARAFRAAWSMFIKSCVLFCSLAMVAQWNRAQWSPYTRTHTHTHT